ncbi:hypothetical protein FA13DRAFT_1802699 [Coprinellus micaceus]|uniref:CFEM domain-containing protein n=1 Tax=Coprinellus micaceus TaxID=71717 RepID=A0A4Y7SCJ2_COPMI|nr:hypothetical protein FA13DRAFT_1802699 [Coprinellus micaceus]
MLGCLNSSAAQQDCDPRDLSCVCTNEAYIETVGECIHANCTQSEAQLARTFGRFECSQAGHPVKTSGDPEHFFSDEDVVNPIGPSPQLASFSTKVDTYSGLWGVVAAAVGIALGFIMY